jgi:hypothetical protein
VASAFSARRRQDSLQCFAGRGGSSQVAEHDHRS